MRNNIDWLPILFAAGLLSVIALAMLQTLGITAADLVALAQGAWGLWKP